MKLHNYTLLFLLSLLILNSCQEKREIGHPFCHHVYFWLNNPNDSADREAFEKGIAELLKIPEIKSYHLGIPAQTGHREVVDGSYTYSYMVFFENEQGHDVYQQHPIHLKFVEDCQHLWNRVVVYDSVLK